MPAKDSKYFPLNNLCGPCPVVPWYADEMQWPINRFLAPISLTDPAAPQHTSLSLSLYDPGL